MRIQMCIPMNTYNVNNVLIVLDGTVLYCCKQFRLQTNYPNIFQKNNKNYFEYIKRLDKKQRGV